MLQVGLHKNVVGFLRHEATTRKVKAFYEALQKERREPAKHSFPLSDPSLSRYMLRAFRFATCVAVFRLDAGRNRMRVLKCRRVPPSQLPADEPSETDRDP